MKTWMKWVLLLLLTGLIGSGILYFRANRYTPIDQWVSALTEEKIQWAEVAWGYGEEKISYEIPEDEYYLLIHALKTVNEENSTRKVPEGTERTDSRLALRYDGKLWLFNCKNNGYLVGLTFEDAETGAIYGCEGKTLYITSHDLSFYILDTIEEKAS